MHALNVLNSYTPDEVVAVQEAALTAIMQAVENGTGIPTYRTLAGELGLPVLVITKMIEQQPDLYDLMNMARTALANEIEARLAQLAMGELGSMMPAGPMSEKYFSGMDSTEVAAAKMLLEANSVQYQKKTVNVTVNNPRVMVGPAGKDAAQTALEQLNQVFLNR